MVERQGMPGRKTRGGSAERDHAGVISLLSVPVHAMLSVVNDSVLWVGG